MHIAFADARPQVRNMSYNVDPSAFLEKLIRNGDVDGMTADDIQNEAEWTPQFGSLDKRAFRSLVQQLRAKNTRCTRS